jgi:hypothetical protein
MRDFPRPADGIAAAITRSEVFPKSGLNTRLNGRCRRVACA